MAGPPVVTNGSNTRFAPKETDHTILNPGDMWWWMEGQAWLSAAKLFDHYLASKNITHTKRLPHRNLFKIERNLMGDATALPPVTEVPSHTSVFRSRLVASCNASAFFFQC